jgi:hypothetical protein
VSAPHAAPAPAPAGLFSGRPLTRGERCVVALIIGVLSTLAVYASLSDTPRYAAKDFTYPWRAANALLAGENPYQVIRPTGHYPFESWFPYPLTAAIVAIPFAFVPAVLAGAIFFGLSAGALAFAVTRDGLQRLWLFASAPFALCLIVVQWVPLLMAGVLLLPLGWALACKPTLGAAVWLYRPSWKTAAMGAALTAVALAVQPTWPSEWLRAVSVDHVSSHPSPVTRPFGWLPLLALLRWRKPEARLVAAMALVPQNLCLYDQLPLWFAAPSGAAGLALSAVSWVGLAVSKVDRNAMFACGPDAEWGTIWFLYVPALLIVLVDAATVRDARDRMRRWLH